MGACVRVYALRIIKTNNNGAASQMTSRPLQTAVLRLQNSPSKQDFVLLKYFSYYYKLLSFSLPRMGV